MTTVTSIGIGNMGAALASTLLKSTNPPQLTIWNRTADRPQVKSLVDQGAHFEPSLAAAVARSETILICLLDYPTITAAFQAITTAKPLEGKTVINVTNGTPTQARQAEADFKQLGAAAYYDGGIMVTPQLVGTPASFVVLSGESDAAFEAGPRELLKPIGAINYVAPDAGAAALYDVAALASMYGMFMGAFTGIALLKKQRRREPAKEGEAAETKVLAKPATDAVVVPLLKALVPYVSLLADGVDNEDWMNDLGNPLGMQAACMQNIVQTCDEEGVESEGLRYITQLMNRAVEEGFGPGGLSAIGQYLFK